MSDNDTQIEQAEIGQLLRAARETSGASIDDVAAILRIRSDHLQALEEDDFERLPGSVYAIGFIRTYATHLGLNAAELIDRYKAATTLPHLEEPSYDPQVQIEATSNAVKIAVVLGAVFVVYLMWLIAGGARDDAPQVAQVTSQAEQSETRDGAAPLARPRTAQKPNSTAQQTPPVQTQAPAPVTSDASAPQSSEPASGEAVANNDASAVLPEADPLASDPKVDVSAIAEIKPAAERKIEIRANRRTWMRIENTEGKVLFSSIIRDDESFALEALSPYTLATRDAGALEYVVDGEAVGTVGRRGQILTAREINRDAILALQP